MEGEWKGGEEGRTVVFTKEDPMDGRVWVVGGRWRRTAAAGAGGREMAGPRFPMFPKAPKVPKTCMLAG